MSNSWDDRKKAIEDEYFRKQNEQALKRLNDRKDSAVRLSPVSGKPMKQEVLKGVIIDRCEESGGVWLDKGELEAILAASEHEHSGGLAGIIKSFIK